MSLPTDQNHNPQQSKESAAENDLFVTEPEQPISLPIRDAELTFYKSSGIDHHAYLTRLLEQTPWQQKYITLFGKRHPQPRLEAWYGDAGARYTYSGISHEPNPWTGDLAKLKQRVESLSGESFNSVLLNLYRDGNDAMGLHADDEPELGRHPVIASLSLGAQRRMYFRHKRDKSIKTFSLDLPSGSLLIMRGDTQNNWKHGLRRTALACTARINLTFRTIR